MYKDMGLAAAQSCATQLGCLERDWKTLSHSQITRTVLMLIASEIQVSVQPAPQTQ